MSPVDLTIHPFSFFSFSIQHKLKLIGKVFCTYIIKFIYSRKPSYRNNFKPYSSETSFLPVYKSVFYLFSHLYIFIFLYTLPSLCFT